MSRILVIEDNLVQAQSLCRLLESRGYQVALALTGPQGVKLASEWEPDLVLSDINLPGLNGFGVARAVRENADTPLKSIIAITGDSENDRLSAQEAGFDYFLEKPVDPGFLLELMNAKLAN